MNDAGWFRYYRKSTENEFYFSERFTKWQAWVDLLTLATYKSRTVFIRGMEINLKPGELCWAIESLAKRWRWNWRTVDRFLVMLSIRKMIHSRKSNITTVITIQNWDDYQASAEQSTKQSADKQRRKKKGRRKSDSEEHAVPPPKDSLAPKNSVPAVSEFVGFFCAEHLARRRSEYAVQRGRDNAAAKSMIESLGLEECKVRAVRYLSHEDKWTHEHGFSIGNMFVVINGLGGNNEYAKTEEVHYLFDKAVNT